MEKTKRIERRNEKYKRGRKISEVKVKRNERRSGNKKNKEVKKDRWRKWIYLTCYFCVQVGLNKYSPFDGPWWWNMLVTLNIYNATMAQLMFNHKLFKEYRKLNVYLCRR